MSTATLTDRYVWAVQRSLPEAKRADIDRELRASIADAVDARTENGEPESDALRSVLLDLGDPARLAAGYAGGPLALIGPALYVDYIRLLRLLLAIVLPCVVGALVLAGLLAGQTPGGILGSAVGTTLTVGVHLCFWVTLVFVILERNGQKTPLVPFDPATLPALPPANTVKIPDLVATIAAGVIAVGAIFWQQTSSVFHTPQGDPIPVLDPALWSFWIPVFIGFAVLGVVHGIVLYRTGRWTVPLAVAHAIIQLAAAIPVIALLVTGHLLNAAFFAEFDADAVMGVGGAGTVATAVAYGVFVLWSMIDGFWKALKRRAG